MIDGVVDVDAGAAEADTLAAAPPRTGRDASAYVAAREDGASRVIGRNGEQTLVAWRKANT